MDEGVVGRGVDGHADPRGRRVLVGPRLGVGDSGQGEEADVALHVLGQVGGGQARQLPGAHVVHGGPAGGEQVLGVGVAHRGEALLEGAGLAQVVEPLGHGPPGCVGELRLALLQALDVLLPRHPEGLVGDVALQGPAVQAVQGDRGDARGGEGAAQLGELVQGGGDPGPRGGEEGLVVPEHLDAVLQGDHVQRPVVEALVVQGGGAVVRGDPVVVEQGGDVDHLVLARELAGEGGGVGVEELGELVRRGEGLVLLDVGGPVGGGDEGELEAGVLLGVLLGDRLHGGDDRPARGPRQQPRDLAGLDLAGRVDGHGGRGRPALGAAGGDQGGHEGPRRQGEELGTLELHGVLLGMVVGWRGGMAAGRPQARVRTTREEQVASPSRQARPTRPAAWS